jgi:hypothetical protein
MSRLIKQFQFLMNIVGLCDDESRYVFRNGFSCALSGEWSHLLTYQQKPYQWRFVFLFVNYFCQNVKNLKITWMSMRITHMSEQITHMSEQITRMSVKITRKGPKSRIVHVV